MERGNTYTDPSYASRIWALFPVLKADSEYAAASAKGIMIMLPSFNRLAPKLILSTITFLLFLALLTAFLVTRGFQQTLANATQRSEEGLEKQGSAALLDVARREAQVSTMQFKQAVETGQIAADYMVKSRQDSLKVSWDTIEYIKLDPTDGRYINTDPNPHTDIYIPSYTPLDAELARNMRESAVLDTLFPTLLEQYRDAVSMYYLDGRGFTRYYPVIGISKMVAPDYAPEKLPLYTRLTPAADPDRAPRWMPPYIDVTGFGLTTTMSVPIYDGDEFRGVIGVDVSLARLIDRLNNIKLTETGYAFLIDHEGHLIAAPSKALPDIDVRHQVKTVSITSTLGLDITDTPNDDFKGVLDHMRAGKANVEMIALGNRPVFIAYAPLPDVNWSLALVAPVSEVTAQSATVSAAISQGTDDTVRSTLLTMGFFFLLALIGMIVLSRRLTRPIEALVVGTRAIGSGDLNVTIPVTSRDELGILAHSFNQMTSELSVARGRLETWNQTLERTVEQRTAELAAATTEAQDARAAAEQANQLKSQFLANMSHELRTPLNSIINFTRILSSGMRGPVNEGQIDYLNRVRQSGQHLLGLINDILDLSKIEAGRMELFKESLQIGELVHSVLATAIGLTKDKPIELCQEIAPNLPPVEADHTRIRQVLLNLLSNAAKFTDEGTITVRVVHQGDELIVSVADTGIGVAQEHIATIFEEFRQIEGSSSRRYEGTGLGLAICRRFIEMHGGKIWAESTVGVGSTFSFSLPVAQTPQAEEAGVVIPPIEHRGAVILVIDDDPAAIEIISSYLGWSDYTVHGVSDSRRALDVVRRLQPSAIILDVMMPYKDGWEVLADLKSDPELQAIPVLLYTIAEERRLGFYLGASAYLTKPIDEDQLRAAVAQLVATDATVLVIDDDPNALEIISRHLKGVGPYRVVEASGGRAGLEQVARERPDLIILDLMMPEIDGFAVLEQLDQDIETEPIPVIVLTAKDLTIQERDFLNQRVSGLISKELTPPEQLLSKVTDLLGAVMERPALNGTTKKRS